MKSNVDMVGADEMPCEIAAMLDDLVIRNDVSAAITISNTLMVWGGALDGQIKHIEGSAEEFVSLIAPHFAPADLEVFLDWLGIIRNSRGYQFIGINGLCGAPLKMRAFRDRLFEGYNS